MEWFKLFIKGLTRLTEYQRVISSLACCDLCSMNLHESLATEITGKQTLLCHNCFNDLPLFKQQLVQGDLLQWPAIHQAMPNRCFDRLFSLSPYIDPFDNWLIQFKYQGRFELASLFADLLAEQWRNIAAAFSFPKIDLVLSVPLHIKKWQLRGYNQAHLIALPFAKKLGVAYSDYFLLRVKNDCSQVGKTGSDRRKNLRNAFALYQEIPATVKHVVLVDDVVTTGSTASEIAKLLKSAGVETVTLVTVCFSLPNH